MTNGIAILIKIVGGEAKSKLQCQEANVSEISLALAHIEMIKLELVEAFTKLTKKE